VLAAVLLELMHRFGIESIIMAIPTARIFSLWLENIITTQIYCNSNP